MCVTRTLHKYYIENEFILTNHIDISSSSKCFPTGPFLQTMYNRGRRDASAASVSILSIFREKNQDLLLQPSYSKIGSFQSELI